MTAKRFFLDRIEGDIAILTPDGSEARRNVPRAKLPRGAREGVWLIQPDPQKEEYTIDGAATETATSEVQNLMDELSGG